MEKIKATGHGALPFKRPAESLDINDNKNTTVHLDFNPNSGVTFRENRNSDVQVVGRGYGDDSSSMYDTRSQQTNVRSRDRRRTSSKGEEAHVKWKSMSYPLKSLSLMCLYAHAWLLVSSSLVKSNFVILLLHCGFFLMLVCPCFLAISTDSIQLYSLWL